MSLNNITADNLSMYINQFKCNLTIYERNYEELDKDRYNCENEFSRIKEKCEVMLKRVATGSIKLEFKVHEDVQLDSFVGVVNKIKERLREIFNRLESLKAPRSSGDTAEAVRIDSKSRTAHLSNYVLSSRQTSEPFIFLTLKSTKNLSCSTCKEPILINCDYLAHLEKYPPGSNQMKKHYYHIKVQCFFVRGFQSDFLKCSKVICKENINEALMKTLQDIGFSFLNIQNKDESDCESDCDTVSLNSGASREQINISQYIYRRKNNLLNEKVICTACHKNITPDSYLTQGKTLSQPFHITKECIQSAKLGHIDFSQIKCRVYKLLRNHNEIKQLLSCGFYYNNIIGFRPPNPTTKGFIREGGDEPQKTTYFSYKRNDDAKNKNLICVGCKKKIYQNTYLLRADSLNQPFHIKKGCILNNESGLHDLSRIQCIVKDLLRDQMELKRLESCGFHYNNIIGIKPINMKLGTTGFKVFDLEAASLNDTASKDIGFIFNEENFSAERLLQGERCQGCSLFLKKDEWSFRHKERIPREKLLESPLVSQFYHTTKDCLLRRGFTEKFLEYSKCNVNLNKFENIQKINDIIIRCGFSSDNLSLNTLQDVSSITGKPTKDIPNNSQSLYLFVVICSNTFTFCEGCDCNIENNSTCFKYGSNMLQDSVTTFFHFREACLKKKFANKLSTITCINNNSLADVTTEDIQNCGVMKIESKITVKPKNNRNNGKGATCNPLKLNKLKFVVDVVMGNQEFCSACKNQLQMDRYVLIALNSDNSPLIKMHLDAGCVRKCGYYPQQLSACDLSLDVFVSPIGYQRLKECGFRNIPD